MSSIPVNDINICIATANGSGSASSNSVLFKSLFKMGLPCSAKNLFPSNIQGLPTWYQIRVSGEGFLGRKDVIDVMVLFNEATAEEDVDKVRPGGLVLYDDSEPFPQSRIRDSLRYVGVPGTRLVRENIQSTVLRAKQRNMVYVGALAQLFDIPLETIEAVLKDTFGQKPTVIESNLLCIKLGYEHLQAQGLGQDLTRLQPIQGGNDNKIMTEADTAAALGAIFGGVTVVGWYPITPSSSLVEEVARHIGLKDKSSPLYTRAISAIKEISTPQKAPGKARADLILKQEHR